MTELLKKYNTWGYTPELTGSEGFRFDLQLFAAEDEGRTEEPTEKKIREAREKGQVAKTQEMPQALIVIFGFLVVFMFSSWIYDSMAKVLTYYFTSFAGLRITESTFRNELFVLMIEIGKILAPILVIVTIVGIVGNVAQVGFQMTSHPLKLDWSKIKFDPATMVKKIFFSKQVGMNLFKSLFKVVAIGLVSYLIISADIEDILMTPDITIMASLKLVLTTGLKLIIWTSVLLLVLSIPDYYFQRQEFMESLKMTKQEIKEEFKETMGDPHLRARLREMQREIVMKNMISEVPKADVVVTNPTHFAIALRYERDTMEAPQVTARGLDSMALRIRQIARDNKVPIIENRPLAQEMYYSLEVGDVIPGELFSAVSVVYAELYKKNRYQDAG
ncbi:MAG: flagellar biosynthesis protein FlhB [bacterium]|nr:flagellar biosynthesis protein FlhB [bacterium]